MTSRFDPDTQTLLEPVTVGGTPLTWRSTKTGAIYPSSPEDTLLASENVGEINIPSKYKNTIKVTAYDPVNPFMNHPCVKCKRQIVRFQRLGAEKKVIYVCLCGYISS